MSVKCYSLVITLFRERAAEKLFNQVLNNVLHQLLPRQFTASQNYNLRPRKHDKDLNYRHKQLIRLILILGY